MKRLLVVVTSGLVALALLTGCGEEKRGTVPAAPPSTSTTPTAPASPAPTRPAAANGQTPESASAFVVYWVKSFNHAAKTGDTSALEEASSSDCEPCQKYIKAWHDLPPNERTAGDVWNLTDASILVFPDTPMEAQFQVTLDEGNGPEKRDYAPQLDDSPTPKAIDFARLTEK